ncbi:hypothetical protein ARMGADRAFT_672653 [Armillaria gallica]|uniref:Uncharacterized protein n=1 Tax=Armillaria gallica TaxID=47427 RepID=A0A2H3CKB8_ARMGA|nr:hypothetical protein ARMGADRAFT_672653 [Armillaria gallica]
MSRPEQCLYCGFRESDIPSLMPPHDRVQGEDVFECLRVPSLREIHSRCRYERSSQRHRSYAKCCL